MLFPQLRAIAERFLREKVIPQAPAERIDVFISPYYGLAIERMIEAIKPDTSAGEAPELPAIEANRPPLQLIRAGRIPVKRLDGRIRVPAAALQAFLDAMPEGYAPGKPVCGEHRAGAAWERPAPGAPNRH